METSGIGRPTFGGLASGLDTTALLDGLLALERQPLERIESRRVEIDRQRGLMRELNGKLLRLRDAAREIDNRNRSGSDFSFDEEFLRYEGSSANEDVVTVSAGSGASPGDIDVKVLQLAQGSRRFSETFTQSASDAALSGQQSLTIALPNADPDAVPPVEATEIVIEAQGNTLSLLEIRDQINTSAENGGTIRADVLQLDDDAFQLVLTTTGTGVENELSVSGDLAMRPPDPEDQARGSVIEVFGQRIERETNAIDDVLTGITLELVALPEIDEATGAPSDAPVTVSVGVDVDAVAAALESFVTAYNDVMTFIDGQFRFNEATNQAGPLAGDSTLRDVQRQLRETVSKGFSFERNPNNPFAPSQDEAVGGSVAMIGLELQSGGRLALDRDTLEEALALDPLSVREFLTGAVRETPANPEELLAYPDEAVPDLYDEGFAQLMATRLEQIVRSGDGTFATRDQAYARRLREFDTSIDRFEQRLAQREETLIARFSDLERIISGLQSQQGFLTSL